MAPPALAYTYATQADVEALLSPDGVVGRVDDNATGTPTGTQTGYVASAINWATARVNQYCLGRYDAIDLAQSWVVNEWCIILAAYWLSCRRGNPAPGSFSDLYKEAMDDLKEIRSGAAQLPEIGLRTAGWPAWSNVRVDSLYSLRKVRVERPISEGSQQQAPFKQNPDRAADLIIEI